MAASRPPGLVPAMLVTMVVFFALSVAGIVLLVEGHLIGAALNLAALLVASGFIWWSRRRWAEHRGTLG